MMKQNNTFSETKFLQGFSDNVSQELKMPFCFYGGEKKRW